VENPSAVTGDIVANVGPEVKPCGMYAFDVRRRIAYYLLLGTKRAGRIRHDAAPMVRSLKRRLTSPKSGFRGSADTWPPIVRKKIVRK
jgi:hypothetical protein